MPDRDPDGEVQGFIALIHDINERKLAEQQILEYQERLKALASQLTIAEERERPAVSLPNCTTILANRWRLRGMQLVRRMNPSSEDERARLAGSGIADSA